MKAIIGHDRIKRYFKSISDDASFNHAYLFHGPEMIGKKTFAQELYKQINGLSDINNSDPNLFRISSEKNNDIGIDSIRSLKKFFTLRPIYGEKKCAIIDNAHRLTIESANALLKVLEEPPQYGIIFLITHMKGQLPQTIVSRCESINFSVLPDSSILAMEEFKKLKKTDSEFVLKIASGRPGCVINLISENNIKEVQDSISDLRSVLGKNLVEKFKYAQKISEGDNSRQTISWWIDWISSSLKQASGGETKSITKSASILQKLLILHEILSQPQYNQRLALENFFLRV